VLQVAVRILLSVGMQLLTFPLLHLSNMPRAFEGFDSGA
jgi:hypothetical protein